METAVTASCPDCAAPAGAQHADGCDVARCLASGRQRLGCETASEHDCGQDLWTGLWPGYAECAEWGWWTVFHGVTKVGGTGWLRCGPDEPGAVVDLTRLVTEARWDSEAKRWVQRDRVRNAPDDWLEAPIRDPRLPRNAGGAVIFGDLISAYPSVFDETIDTGMVETTEATCSRCGEVRPCVIWLVGPTTAESEPREEPVCMTCVPPVSPEAFAPVERCAHGGVLGKHCMVPPRQFRTT